MNDEKPFENKISSIHTLESDLASAVRDENYGKNIIKIVTDPSQNSMTVQGSTGTKGPGIEIFTKRNILIFFIVVFVLGSAGAILYILNKANNVTEPTDTVDPLATSTNSTTTAPVIRNMDFLNPEIIQSADFSKLNRNEIVQQMAKIKENLTAKNISPDNNVGINTNLTTTQFFEKIRYSGDDALLRSLDSVYAFGLYSMKDARFENYIIIKVSDFDLAFRSILDWEKYMPVDLKDIFVGNNEITTAPVETATTSTSTDVTAPEKKYIKNNTQGFVDRILKNYDIRELVRNEDDTHLIYGFINNKFLLITSGESSFIDIKDRLLKENILR